MIEVQVGVVEAKPGGIGLREVVREKREKG